MQEPLLIAKPHLRQPTNENKLNVIHLRGGLWHPRWALLSGVLTILLCCVGYLFWHSVPCLFSIWSFLSVFCEAYTWLFIMQILLVDLACALGSIFMFIFGYIPESAKGKSDQGTYDPIRRFFQSISCDGRSRWLLSAYGLLVLLGVIAMCWMRPIQPVPLALASIVLLVVVWTQLYHYLSTKELIKEEAFPHELAVSPWYFFCCLPLIRAIPPFLGKKSVNPGTTVADMQPFSQTSAAPDDVK